jgi:signal transduction histidine kinase
MCEHPGVGFDERHHAPPGPAALPADLLLAQRLEDVARASGDWMWETDARHHYTWVHGGGPGPWQPVVGTLIPAGQVVNWLGEPDPPLRDLHTVLDACQPMVRLVTEEQVQGQRRYISRSAVVLTHADGTLRGYRGSARDVTQGVQAKANLWRREQASRLAMEQAEATSREKSVLVSKVGHELRTPLNAIVGLAQLIQAQGSPADAATVERWIAQIAKTGSHMAEVLDMLMELGRASASQASLLREPVDVVGVVRDAIRMVEQEAQARLLSIAFDHQGTTWARGDRRALCQVLVNLLSNAIKYNRSGGWVRLSVADGEQTRIDIEDSGPGLSDTHVGRLYRSFERLGAQASSVKGLGLGLSICKELVGLMHGTIEVRSAPGHGTTFTVRLPGL